MRAAGNGFGTRRQREEAPALPSAATRPTGQYASRRSDLWSRSGPRGTSRVLAARL